MSPAAADRWERVRAGGRERFVWVKGVLLGGVTLGFCTAVVAAGLDGPARFPRLLMHSVAGFAGAGYFWGRWVWSLNEEAYAKARGQE